jgi:tyrosine-protein phosphatase YwqE
MENLINLINKKLEQWIHYHPMLFQSKSIRDLKEILAEAEKINIQTFSMINHFKKVIESKSYIPKFRHKFFPPEVIYRNTSDKNYTLSLDDLDIEIYPGSKIKITQKLDKDFNKVLGIEE